MIPEYTFTEEDRIVAKERATWIQNPNEFTELGFLGETLFEHFFPHSRYVNSRDYDFYSKLCRIEIKTTSVHVSIDHINKVFAAANTEDKDYDYLVFTAVKTTLACGWILGWITKEKFLSQATLDKYYTLPRSFLTPFSADQF
jgi:hypothetical protein